MANVALRNPIGTRPEASPAFARRLLEPSNETGLARDDHSRKTAKPTPKISANTHRKNARISNHTKEMILLSMILSSSSVFPRAKPSARSQVCLLRSSPRCIALRADRRAPRSTLATRHSPLATRHSPLATRHSPLATRHSPLVTAALQPSGFSFRVSSFFFCPTLPATRSDCKVASAAFATDQLLMPDSSDSDPHK